MSSQDIRQIDRKRLAALFDFAVTEDEPETALPRAESKSMHSDSSQDEPPATDINAPPDPPTPDNP